MKHTHHEAREEHEEDVPFCVFVSFVIFVVQGLGSNKQAWLMRQDTRKRNDDD